MTGDRALGLGVAGIVAAAIVGGLATVGGPWTARLERFDERRARDLPQLVRLLEHHRAEEGRLPASLEAIEPRLPADVSARDPETGNLYDYDLLEGGRLRLCARIAIADPGRKTPTRIDLPGPSQTEAHAVPDPTGQRLCWESH